MLIQNQKYTETTFVFCVFFYMIENKKPDKIAGFL